MERTVARNGSSRVNLGGRPTEPGIEVIETIMESIAREENCAERLLRTIHFLEHIRTVGGRLESDLVGMARSIYNEIPAMRDAAGIAEELRARGAAA